MSDHSDKATQHLEKALDPEDDANGWMHVAAAGVHAVLHVADAIRHGLRDVVYEMRD